MLFILPISLPNSSSLEGSHVDAVGEGETVTEVSVPKSGAWPLRKRPPPACAGGGAFPHGRGDLWGTGPSRGRSRLPRRGEGRGSHDSTIEPRPESTMSSHMA